MQTRERIVTSSQAMHKFVFWGAGIWVLFVLTFAIAYIRVANSGKFNGIPFRSLTNAEPQRPSETYK